MKNYNTGVSSKVFASLVAVLVVTSGVVAIAIYFPGGGTGPPPGPSSLGAKTAEFLNSMRENVQHYFIANCSFVNLDITNFYAQSEPTAFVDSVMMNRTETGGQIDVLFSPWDAGIVGSGAITTAQWNSLSGLIVDDGVGSLSLFIKFGTRLLPRFLFLGTLFSAMLVIYLLTFVSWPLTGGDIMFISMSIIAILLSFYETWRIWLLKPF